MKKRLLFVLIVVCVLACVLTACDGTTYSVTFDPQNGESAVTVPFDKQFEIPTFTNDPKVFGGWYTDPECTDGNEWTKPQTLTEPISVYAKWGDPTYSVTFDPQNGAEAIVVPFDKDFSEPKIENGNKVFAGWFTDPDGSFENKWQKPETLSGDITVYAVWREAADLSALAAYYNNDSLSCTIDYFVYAAGQKEDPLYDQILKKDGFKVSCTIEDGGSTYTDFITFNEAENLFVYYYDYGDGGYEVISSDEEVFEEYYAEVGYVNLSAFGVLQFYKNGDCYSAIFPQEVGNTIFDEWEGATEWMSVDMYVANDRITKITAVLLNYEADYGGVYYFEADFSQTGATTVTVPDISVHNDAALAAILEKYQDDSKWNFKVNYDFVIDNEAILADVYEFMGNNFKLSYNYEGVDYTDYLGYDEATESLTYYSDNGDGTYETVNSAIEEDYFWYFYSEMVYYIGLDDLCNLQFNAEGNHFVAAHPVTAANRILGNTGADYEKVELYTANGEVSKIVVSGTYYDEESLATYDCSITLTLSKYGQVNFTLPTSGGAQKPEVPSNVMPNQTYNEATFDNSNLQEKMEANETASGMPSLGSYHALIVPVQFKGSSDLLTSAELENLNKAFNGTTADTGWQSVASFYKTSSYGKLNLTYDIWGYTDGFGTKNTPYTTKYAVNYYENCNQTAIDNSGESYDIDGSECLLLEVLNSLKEHGVDLSKYDSNNDGFIDAVYLIYNHEIDYVNDDAFWWAYVSWSFSNQNFGSSSKSLQANAYMFASIDFMNESVTYVNKDYPKINGLKINAATYIHESGHLMDLDDYYDYNKGTGSDEGLGGADMMDYTVGDHNVYSKIMMGWLKPKIITSTQTFTIDISNNTSDDDCVMLLLDSNNSYFCEYLLIDLYSATGLNALHAAQQYSYLYDGASFGARIYHVTNFCEKPYGDSYKSFTDCNNSLTDTPLIKLVEADGYTKFSDSEGYASRTDLWQTGDKLSSSFPSYTRNDGKAVNFDISFDSVTATSVTITVTFLTAQ